MGIVVSSVNLGSKSHNSGHCAQIWRQVRMEGRIVVVDRAIWIF